MEYTPKSQWEYIYQTIPQHQIPWETGEASPDLVSLFKEKAMQKGMKVLDGGCGLGTQTIFMAKMGAQVTGIDVSETAIKKARERFLKEAIGDERGNANFVIGDVCKMPMPTASFEFVYDRGCYHHLSPRNRQEYVQEVRRVLAPGGMFHLLVFAGALTIQEVIDYFLPDFQPAKVYEDTVVDHTNNQEIPIHIVRFKKN